MCFQNNIPTQREHWSKFTSKDFVPAVVKEVAKLCSTEFSKKPMHDVLTQWKRSHQDAKVYLRHRKLVQEPGDRESKQTDDHSYGATAEQQQVENTCEFHREMRWNEKCMLVVQTAWQQRLMRRYGNSLTILDALHRTIHYRFPIFFVLVKTNVDYQVCS